MSTVFREKSEVFQRCKKCYFFDYESVGRRFESCRAHHKNQGVMANCLTPFSFQNTKDYQKIAKKIFW